MKTKRLSIIALLIGVIAYCFWTGSRYPQLNEKALMGGDMPTKGISFDVLYEVDERDGVWEKIFFNTINWLETNKKGMTFGLLFAAALILLFSQISEQQFNNRWLNAAMGLVIGVPLGVCVNCAAPIAKGISDAGGRTETALATMISSPTFNIIVLSMLFSLFPTYMIVLKITLTLLFILLFIPILTKLFPKNQPTSLNEISDNTKIAYVFQPSDPILFKEKGNWWQATKWVGTNYTQSLWFIVKTAVPLMLLAGLLGNILVTFLPLEQLQTLLPQNGLFKIGIAMLFLAFFGTFLPVPMTFDVIIVAVLISIGIPEKYAMILLFTMGVFSIYSFFIVQKAMSKKLAIAMYISIMALGGFSGILAEYWQNRVVDVKNKQLFTELPNTTKTPTVFEHKSTSHPIPLSEMNLPAAIHSLKWRTENIEVFETPFTTKKHLDNKWFKQIEGEEVGLAVPFRYSAHHLIQPFSNHRAVATGDIHQDGFPDCAIVSHDSIFLFANLQGQSFARQLLPFHKQHIHGVALVDLDNDTWLDLFITTIWEGNYWIKNEKGSFAQSEATRLPQEDQTILSMSVAFADINNNGRLDFLLGNWHSMQAYNYTSKTSKNYGYFNQAEGFTPFEVAGTNGETLTTLFSDFNMDGDLDLIIGNDFEVADYYFSGSGAGQFKAIEQQDSVIEISTKYTMSVFPTDINNDLVPEIYQVQNNRDIAQSSKNISDIVAVVANPDVQSITQNILHHHKEIHDARREKNLLYCPDGDSEACAAYQLYVRTYPMKPNKNKQKSLAFYQKRIPAQWKYFKTYFNDLTNCTYIDAKEQPTWIAQKFMEQGKAAKVANAVLLQKTDKAYEYEDKVATWGIGKTGWAWNAKFADLDNDSWQDVFIVNGFLVIPKHFSNVLYQNQKGQSFQNKTTDSGLENHLPASTYSYFDYDLDGDLDILLTPEIGPVFLCENQNQANHSIAFELRDHQGNHYGIGSKIFIYYGDGKHQYRELLLSGGYKSFDETVAYFGLGEHTQVQKVEVEWSTGERTIINESFEAGRRYRIERE